MQHRMALPLQKSIEAQGLGRDDSDNIHVLDSRFHQTIEGVIKHRPTLSHIEPSRQRECPNIDKRTRGRWKPARIFHSRVPVIRIYLQGRSLGSGRCAQPGVDIANHTVPGVAACFAKTECVIIICQSLGGKHFRLAKWLKP